MIFDQKSNEFVGICNKTSLVKWSYETQDLKKKHFKQVGSDIRAVLTSEELEEPVVVFFNGYVENLGSVCEGRKKARGRKLRENEEIVKQWLAKGGLLVNVILLTERNKEYQLVIVSVPCEDGGTAFHFSLERPTEESTIYDSCFFKDGDLSWLFVLWSNGSVWRYSLDVVMRTEDRSQHLDGQRILTLSSDSNMSMVRISAIHADYIAISGLRGLDDKSSETLSIWCIPFGTLQCHVRLPTSQRQTEGVGEGHHLVWLKGHLFCSTSSSLTCHSCHCENGTLAQALGKLSVASKDEEEENVVIKWSTDEVVVEKSSVDILKIKKRVLDMMLGADKRKSIHAYQKDVQTLQNQSISAILDILKKVAEDFSRRNVKESLPREMVEILIKTSKLAASACPEFLSAVLENGSPDLILMCVEYMQDIPEPFMVKCLEFFLSVEESRISSTIQNGSNFDKDVSKSCPLGQRQRCCINRVMGCPFNSVFLLSSMKNVQFDLILIFSNIWCFSSVVKAVGAMENCPTKLSLIGFLLLLMHISLSSY